MRVSILAALVALGGCTSGAPPALPRAQSCDGRIAATDGLGLAAETGVKLDGRFLTAKTSFLAGDGEVTMWLKVEGGLVEADLVLDGCPTARMAITQSGGTTTERIGAWEYRVARTTAGKTIGAVLDVSGGSVFLYTVGVSDQVLEAVLASVQVLTGDEWRSYRDSLPKGTISK